MTEQAAAPKTDEIIAKYIALRDSIAGINKRAKDEIAPLQTAMDTIESYLMNLMNNSGQNTMGTSAGTAFITTKTGCNISDKTEFVKYLLEDPERVTRLLTISANKTAVGEHIDKNGTPPPGIKWVVMREVQVRR